MLASISSLRSTELCLATITKRRLSCILCNWSRYDINVYIDPLYIAWSELIVPSILQSYHLFGHRYDVIGCINYNLEKAGGGHYITKLFPRQYDAWEVHEDSVKNVKRKPDFDTDAFIVCLKRFGKNNLLPECYVTNLIKATCFPLQMIFLSLRPKVNK